MANSKASFSLPSLIALVAAILIFVVNNGFLVFLLAGVAIIFGLLGIILSLAPSVRGGIVSFLGIGAGLIGVIMAMVKLLQAIF
ncbi:hypothetical protein OVA24_08290 [Luteolibacter sp. SL250]|uniref:hypothetical protein n=1 Tax=Luteolibacter sp. SL250 TaxID=2995170 RepID=UPI00226D51DD|nr:hypothetical protein [Luteolibacter sp. SL250]WAC21384.1 hypothetical protein OVA24_08290 [Luteolibacter sp. SL250]